MEMLIKTYTGYFSPREIIRVMVILEIQFNKYFFCLFMEFSTSICIVNAYV